MPEQLIFVDESGVNRAMTRTHARSPRGSRAFGSAPRHWGDNVSILGALCLRGTLEPRCVNGATNGPVFLAYLEHCLVPPLWPGAVVVSWTTWARPRPRAGASASRRPALALLYLSPDSPDFNPIEMAWSKLKTALRKVAARTTEALERAIGEGLRAVSAADACGYFARCGYR